jgi:hypothetical protein
MGIAFFRAFGVGLKVDGSETEGLVCFIIQNVLDAQKSNCCNGTDLGIDRVREITDQYVVILDAVFFLVEIENRVQ